MVDADHQVIVASELNDTAVDVQQLAPMNGHTAETLGRMHAQWTIDAGYRSAANLEHVKEIKTAGGTD
ncbi:hypothetical protein ACQCSV_01540 [Pseudarthrobacter sp. S3]|uniref:hypothetical protein n=1 Tax=Pseudarthrobacter sp. S3 TaxID=3418419 RepID=UPI003CF3E789